MGFTELHFHLLPGIDDGPPTMADSLALAAAAVADGTELVHATPHIRSGLVETPLELADRVAELADCLRRESIPLAVRAAGELSYEMVARLADAELDAIAHGPTGRRWLLLESPLEGRDPAFTSAADELRARGFRALLAHPERSRPNEASEHALRHELAAGTLPQINAWSVAGRYGPAVRRLALTLLRGAPGAPIASDAHGPERMPSLRLGIAALLEAGEPAAARRAGAIPRSLIERGLPDAPVRRAA